MDILVKRKEKSKLFSQQTCSVTTRKVLQDFISDLQKRMKLM